MADERTEGADKGDASAAHAGPTIDLDASQVTDKTENETEEAAPQSAPDEAPRAAPAPRGASTLLAGLGGGIAGALAVAGGLWFWFDGFAPPPPPPAVTSAQFSNMTANVDALTARLAKAEAAAARPLPSPDAALTRRTEAAEAAFASMRDELAAMKAQLAAAGKSLDELKAEARAPAAPPDFTRVDERLDRLDRAMQALQAETAKREPAVAEDVNARRLAVASALDMAVSRGEPFASQLAAAKQLAAAPQALGALDAFAAKGVPGETVYLRQIVTILEQAEQATRPAAASAPLRAATPAAEVSTLDRLQAGFAKLVRIERADAPAAATVPPPRALPAVNASDDLAGVRRDVAKLPQAAQPEIQTWLKSVEARAAALAASRSFANDALAALAKSGQ